MSAAELDLHVETESERIERWRAEELERAGYDPPTRSSSQRGRTSTSTSRSSSSSAAVLRTRALPASSSSVAFQLAAHPSGAGRICCPCCHSPRSPRPHGVVDIGPLHIHMYGLMLLLAIAACIGLTGFRWTRLGGDWDLVLRVAVWGVAFGIVGARALPRHHELERGARPSGGARSPSGRAASASGAGSCSAASPAPSSSAAPGESVRLFADAVAPGLLVAQGIGRLGNWFNQELFGKPTNLPVGPEDRRASTGRRSTSLSDTFHPTFLYELIYDLAMAGVLILIGSRFRIRPPGAVRALRRLLHASGARSRSCCGSTRRTTSPASG